MKTPPKEYLIFIRVFPTEKKRELRFIKSVEYDEDIGFAIQTAKTALIEIIKERDWWEEPVIQIQGDDSKTYFQF